MNPETVKAVQEALAPVAQKLGEGAAHLYEIYVRQIYAEGLVTVIMGLATIFIVIPIIFLVARTINNSLDELDKGIPYFAAGAITFILLVLSFVFIPDGAMKLINPEYYAIERLVNQVRGN